MGNSRPLQDLSDEQLLELWNVADEIDDFGHETLYHICGYDDNLLTGEDIQFIRAGLLLQIKLCDKFRIPYPELKEDAFSVGEYEKYIGDFADNVNDDEYDFTIEMEVKNLHRTLDAFTSINGIGDFREEYLKDPVYLLELGGLGFDEEAVGFEKELGYSGYHSLLREIREYGIDTVEIVEVGVTESKKIASFINAVKTGIVPERIAEFWYELSIRLQMRTCYWTPIDNLDEVKEDTWCCVHAIIQHYEEGILICDLYKIMSTRIGAYIAQEFAERYA